MSLVFNDTTTKKGIVQEYEQECGYNDGDVSGNTALLKRLAAQVNISFDDFVELAVRASGRWQWDDSNHTDYPIISTNIVSGQRDYSFTVDGSGNLVLDIYRVLIADSTGVFRDITPVDAQSDADVNGFTDGQNQTGAPSKYDKTANAIFLDPVPNYNYTNGLRVYVNREPSYFTYTDTTKKPGVPGIFHRYFVVKPAYNYARRNTLATLDSLTLELATLERNIKDYYGARQKDERRAFVSANHSNK